MFMSALSEHGFWYIYGHAAFARIAPACPSGLAASAVYASHCAVPPSAIHPSTFFGARPLVICPGSFWFHPLAAHLRPHTVIIATIMARRTMQHGTARPQGPSSSSHASCGAPTSRRPTPAYPPSCGFIHHHHGRHQASQAHSTPTA